MTMLIVGRTFQGISFGGVSSVLLAWSFQISFSMRHRSLYIGLLEIIWGFAGGIGPVLGGTFAQHLSWRWAFWIMLSPCAVAFVLLIFALDVQDPRTGIIAGLVAVDWAGSFCLLTLLIMFLFGVSFGGVEFPWDSPTVICLIVLGACMSVVFDFSEKKLARYPLLPLGIFIQKSNIAALVVGFAQHYVLYAGEFYMPLFFQSAKAVSPVNAGTMILPLALSTSLTGLLAGYYTHRTGRYVELIWLGTALMAAGHGSFISWDATSDLQHADPRWHRHRPPPGAASNRAPGKCPTEGGGDGDSNDWLGQEYCDCDGSRGRTDYFSERDGCAEGRARGGGPRHAATERFSGGNAAANVDAISNITSPVARLAVEQAFAGSLRGLWILDACLCAVGLLGCAFIVQSTLSKEQVQTRTGLGSEKSTP